MLATIASYEPADSSTTAYGRPWFNPKDQIYPRKYTRDGLGVKAETTESGINYRILRFADFLLMYAEVLNETGKTAEAYTYIQQVRTLAKLPNLALVRPNMTEAEMRDQLAHERALEFAIEGQRINDLIRWGWFSDPASLPNLRLMTLTSVLTLQVTSTYQCLSRNSMLIQMYHLIQLTNS